VGAAVLGGDLVRSERYLVDVAVVGTAAHPVRRRGAAAGDALWASGAFGAPGRALADLRGGATPDAGVRHRLAHPEPRLAAGERLAAHGAHAMIDVSDGLAADAGHLAAASGVAVEVALERVPCWPAVPPLEAVASGEEYELVAALPAEFADADAREMERSTGVRLTRIGRCTAGLGVCLTDAGRRVAVPAGWDHFAP
jgi:thiamine-monophosphate kinase